MKQYVNDDNNEYSNHESSDIRNEILSEISIEVSVMKSVMKSREQIWKSSSRCLSEKSKIEMKLHE